MRKLGRVLVGEYKEGDSQGDVKWAEWLLTSAFGFVSDSSFIAGAWDGFENFHGKNLG